MARVSVTSTPLVKTGVVQTLTAPTTDGDVIDTGRVLLVVANATGGSSVTVTVETPLQVDSLDVEDLAVAVAPGTTVYIGPLSKATFGQPLSSADAGRAYVDYSSVTGITRAVYSL